MEALRASDRDEKWTMSNSLTSSSNPELDRSYDRILYEFGLEHALNALEANFEESSPDLSRMISRIIMKHCLISSFDMKSIVERADGYGCPVISSSVRLSVVFHLIRPDHHLTPDFDDQGFSVQVVELRRRLLKELIDYTNRIVERGSYKHDKDDTINIFNSWMDEDILPKYEAYRNTLRQLKLLQKDFNKGTSASKRWLF